MTMANGQEHDVAPTKSFELYSEVRSIVDIALMNTNSCKRTHQELQGTTTGNL
jgi:hypothetical protein